WSSVSFGDRRWRKVRVRAAPRIESTNGEITSLVRGSFEFACGQIGSGDILENNALRHPARAIDYRTRRRNSPSVPGTVRQRGKVRGRRYYVLGMARRSNRE